MTAQEKVRDLVTVSGVPAAQGLIELAQAVLEFDRFNQEFFREKKWTPELREAFDHTYRAMVAKAAVVLPEQLDILCQSDLEGRARDTRGR